MDRWSAFEERVEASIVRNDALMVRNDASMVTVVGAIGKKVRFDDYPGKSAR